MLWLLTVGALGYLLLSRQRGAVYYLIAIALSTLAAIVSGTRTPVVIISISGMVIAAAYLAWGVPWGWGWGQRMLKTVRRTLIVMAVGVVVMSIYFPQVIGGHWAFVSESLAYGGEGSELQGRTFDYPLENMEKAFAHDRWMIGYGTGTSSLGLQYVSKLLGQEPLNIGVESGYGMVLVEMGILGLVLWFVWVGALLVSGWRIVNRLRQTVYFPLGFAIWWYAVVLLVVLPYLSSAYENFVLCAYLWVLVGILFRLPKLAEMPLPAPAPKPVSRMERWQEATSGEDDFSASDCIEIGPPDYPPTEVFLRFVSS